MTQTKTTKQNLKRKTDELCWTTSEILGNIKLHGKNSLEGKWVSEADVLREREELKQKLQNILDDFGSLEEYDNDDVIELHHHLSEVLAELDRVSLSADSKEPLVRKQAELEGDKK